jgi:hypothetical protein
MRIRFKPALLGAALAAMVSCGSDTELPVIILPDGMLMTEFPIVNGAVWVYQNEADASDQYRVSVQGTRNISSYIHYKWEYNALDGAGNPLPGEAPPPSDFYAANGLHQRLAALTKTPGVFPSATFIAVPAEDGIEDSVSVRRPASLSPFPIGAAYVRKSLGDNLDTLGINDDPVGDPSDTDDPAERLTRNRYDEVNTGTIGFILESASEGAGGNQFQKHLPPRRLWEFPLMVGKRWTVFETFELRDGVGVGSQPKIIAERRVASEENVVTPGYSGPALLVEEWTVGLSRDEETGELIIPSIDDENGNGIPDRGEATARYWVASGVGVVKYDYEIFDIAAWQASTPPFFTGKTFVLVRASIPAGIKADGAGE